MNRINDRDANRTMNERRKRLASMPRAKPSPAAIADARRRLEMKHEQRRFKSEAGAALMAEADRRFGYSENPHEKGVM